MLTLKKIANGSLALLYICRFSSYKIIHEYDLKNNVSGWIFGVKNTLLSNGFKDVWYYLESVNEKIFYLYFEQRLSDCFHQNKYLNLPMHQEDYLNYILYDKDSSAFKKT